MKLFYNFYSITSNTGIYIPISTSLFKASDVIGNFGLLCDWTVAITRSVIKYALAVNESYLMGPGDVFREKL